MILYDSVPKCLLGKYQLVGSVTFACFFILLALLVATPFIGGCWLTFAPESGFWRTIALVGAGVAVLTVSRVTMYRTHRTSRQMSYFSYLVWSLSETVALAALYVLFTWAGDFLEPGELYSTFGNAFVFTVVCLGLSYVISSQYYVINDKDNTIRLLNFSSFTSDDTQTSALSAQKITLYDDGGSIKLVVNLSNLFVIESDDNYIRVRYQDSAGTMKQYMLRCRLKTIEDSFAGSDLVRCHRKYIVNINKAEVVFRNKDGYLIDMGPGSSEPIPVSKTYEENVLSRFNSKKS